MNKKALSTAIGFISLVVLSYNACSGPAHFSSKVYGTETTNPMTPVSNELLAAMCGAIQTCNPQVTLSQCQSGLLMTSGFSNPLGISSQYSTLSSIMAAESSGTLAGNLSATNTCSTSIDTLSCSVVNGAYNASLPNPFSGAPGIIPVASCNQDFSPTYASVIVADNPLGYWRLDETSGTTAYDVMGLDNGTYATGPGLILGVAGALSGSSDTAASFAHSGPGDVDINLPTINTAPGTFVTVEFWMKWSGNAFDTMPFGFAQYDLFLWQSVGEFGFNTGNGDLYGVSGNAFTALAGNWAHIVAVMVNMATPSDMTKNQLYINGALQTMAQSKVPFAVTTSSSFRISSMAGGTPQSTPFLFDGAMDEFAIYNYALSQAQVTHHYQAGLGKLP